MIGKKLNFSKPVALFEVKDMVKERLDQNDKGVEPTYEQNMVNEYSKKFVKLTPAKSRKLLEELKKIDGLNENFAIKIADIVPEDIDELNLLVPRGEKFEEPKLKEVLDIVSKYKSN